MEPPPPPTPHTLLGAAAALKTYVPPRTKLRRVSMQSATPRQCSKWQFLTLVVVRAVSIPAQLCFQLSSDADTPPPLAVLNHMDKPNHSLSSSCATIPRNVHQKQQRERRTTDLSQVELISSSFPDPIAMYAPDTQEVETVTSGRPRAYSCEKITFICGMAFACPAKVEDSA